MQESQPWISIASDSLRAEIDPHGAQLSRLTDDGRDLLWNGDPGVWSGRAPLLFPIVGVLAGGSYRLGAAAYRLPRHGFARNAVFSVVEAQASATVLRLCADDTTLQSYPFRFELEVRFRLAGAALSVTSVIHNPAKADLYASFGYHPAFQWPLPYGQPREAHALEFEADERAPVRRIDPGGLLTPTLYPNPVSGRRLILRDELFAEDVLIFERPASRSVVYGGTDGPRLRVEFPDAPYLGIWTKPGAGFICIEPWHGITDPVGFTGDFTSKPGVFMVGPGEHFSSTMAVTLMKSNQSA